MRLSAPPPPTALPTPKDLEPTTPETVAQQAPAPVSESAASSASATVPFKVRSESSAKAESATGFVKLDTRKLDSLVDLVGELVITQSMVVQDPAVQRLPSQNLVRCLRQLARIARLQQRLRQHVGAYGVAGREHHRALDRVLQLAHVAGPAVVEQQGHGEGERGGGLQVEEQVQPISGTHVDYPESLRTSGIEGEVQAQFVVNENGRVESGTFKVLNSANDAFVTAVKRALPEMRFRAARIGDTKVSQVVQQAFVFKLSKQ